MTVIPAYIDDYIRIVVNDSIVTSNLYIVYIFTMTGDSSVFHSISTLPCWIDYPTWYGGTLDLNGGTIVAPIIDGPAVKSISSNLSTSGGSEWRNGPIYIPEGLTLTIKNTFYGPSTDPYNFIGNGTLMINMTSRSALFYCGTVTFPKNFVFVSGTFGSSYLTTQNLVVLSGYNWFVNYWTILGETRIHSGIEFNGDGTIDNFGSLTFSTNDLNFEPAYSTYIRLINHENATLSFAAMETEFFPLFITNYGHIHVASPLNFFSILNYGLITVAPSVTLQGYHEYNKELDDSLVQYGGPRGRNPYIGIGIVCMGEPYGNITLDPLATLAISPTMTGPWNISCNIEGGTVTFTGYSQILGDCNVDTMYHPHPFQSILLLSSFFLP